jgi:alkylation response protein AidB-like acyl-CoA dehydrogenase
MNMSDAGIDLRRLRQASGDDEFNEMFLDGVWIPDGYVVGEPGQGWDVAMTTLMHERAGVNFAYSLELRHDWDRLVAACRERGLLVDVAVRQHLAKLYVDLQSLRLNSLRALTAQASGRPPGPDGSIGKLQRARLSQALTDFAMDTLGDRATLSDSFWSASFLRSRGDSIKGGTSEIQANVLAERVLGLPRLSA